MQYYFVHLDFFLFYQWITKHQVKGSELIKLRINDSRIMCFAYNSTVGVLFSKESCITGVNLNLYIKFYIHHLFRSCTFYWFYNKIYDFYLQLCLYNQYSTVWNTKLCMFSCNWTFTKLFTPFHFQLKYAEITFFWKNTAPGLDYALFCSFVLVLWTYGQEYLEYSLNGLIFME